MELRTDIAEAADRMQVTFGTRTAIRDLGQSLEDGEAVVDMVACQFASGEGLLVLTDRRVMAVRDDFSTFRMKAVLLPEITAVDYAPRVHDGLGILTATGRIAVRRMIRQDADRVVDGILARVPEAILGVSTPSTSGAAPAPAPQVTDGDARGSSGERDEPAPAATPKGGDHPTTQEARPTATSRRIAATDGEVVDSAAANEAALIGMLADLHAQGLLTQEELAVKIAQLTRRS